MLHEQRKVAKIITELTMFFLAIGADTIQSGIEKKGEEGTITLRANYSPDNEEKLEDLEKCLNEQRNDGIEDIYWELAGSGNYGETSQLMLVGLMIDKAEINIEDGFVNLKLYKKFGWE
ncbi:MAG: hypothetical protein HFH91_18200 [Lachnospiraceae bacterium]|jgi:hypothetical protein|nr:hypothetical protein [Lachnospiraceae bacterium]